MKLLPSLDGLRAVSVIMVLISHCGFGDIVPGGFGVTVFFFLSGFLITFLLISEFDKFGSVSYKNFLIRRALRIFVPMYVIYFLLLALVFLGLYPSEVKSSAVIAQLFFLTNYYVSIMGSENIVAGTKVLWSLSVEEHFYIIYPWLLIFALRLQRNHIAMLFFFISTMVLLARYVTWQAGGAADYLETASHLRMDSILIGAVLSIVMYKALLEINSENREIPLSAIPLLLASVVVLLLTFLWREPEFRSVYRYSLQSVSLIPIFYYSIMYSKCFLFRWLGSGILRLVGKYSYVIYLIHAPFVVIFKGFGVRPGLFLVVLVFAASYFFAKYFYQYVERPVLVLKNRFSKK